MNIKDLENIQPTVESEEVRVKKNDKVSRHPHAYTQQEGKDLRFAPEIAHDPRLIKGGIVYGD